MSVLAQVEPADEAAVLSTMIEIIRPYAKGGNLTLGANTLINKLGIDSFDFVEIIFQVEETYAVDFDYNVNSSYKDTVTIGQLSGEVAKLVAAKQVEAKLVQTKTPA